jgi:hypothetical protein
MSAAVSLPTIVDGKRPNFGKKQIRCLDQLYKGLKIRICSEDDRETVVIVARGPYRECGKLKIDVKFRKDKSSWTKPILLEKYSVVRYEDKSWELTNWLEKA